MGWHVGCCSFCGAPGPEQERKRNMDRKPQAGDDLVTLDAVEGRVFNGYSWEKDSIPAGTTLRIAGTVGDGKLLCRYHRGSKDGEVEVPRELAGVRFNGGVR